MTAKRNWRDLDLITISRKVPIKLVYMNTTPDKFNPHVG